MMLKSQVCDDYNAGCIIITSGECTSQFSSRKAQLLVVNTD